MYKQMFVCFSALILLTSCTSQVSSTPVPTQTSTKSLTSTITPTLTSTPKPMSVKVIDPRPDERVFKLGDVVELGKIVKFTVNNTDDYSVHVYSSDGEIDVSWDSDTETSNIPKLSNLQAGRYELILDVMDRQTNYVVTNQLKHIVIVDRIGFPLDGSDFPKTGVNLSYPPVMGFDRVIEQAKLYFENVDGNIAVRFGVDTYSENRQGYYKIMDSISNLGNIVIIAPNLPSKTSDI